MEYLIQLLASALGCALLQTIIKVYQNGVMLLWYLETCKRLETKVPKLI